jgi:hypothetical protein
MSLRTWLCALPFALAVRGGIGTVAAQGASAMPSGARVVTVHTHDFAFELPDALPAGLTTFRLRNEGHEPHHLMLYALDPGKRLSDVLVALSAGGPYPAWMHAVGGPNAAPPHGESIGTVVLIPGSYVVFCHVKSPDLVLHFAKGMIRALTVTPAPEAVNRLPAAGLTITLRDYSFAFSRPPTRGWHRIAVHNAGTQPHELILARLRRGKTTQDFIAWINTRQGPSPVIPAGGTTDLPVDGTMVIDVTLRHGAYSMVCRVRDATDGRPHDEHGMHLQFDVP